MFKNCYTTVFFRFLTAQTIFIMKTMNDNNQAIIKTWKSMVTNNMNIETNIR